MNNQQDKEIWIFLSHSNKDFDKVRLIRNYLEEHSLRPLMFYLKCLSNDDEINDLIKREIDCRTRFVVCQSENSINSKWVQSEVNYIKFQKRSYETIDLGKTIDEIKKQLDKMIKSTQIFFSYVKEDYDFVQDVYSHICKYDIRCFFDSECKYDGNYQKKNSYAIDLAKYYDFVIFFASESSLNANHVIGELQFAAEKGAKILVLIMDKYAKTHYKYVFPDAQNIPENDLLDREQTSVKVRDLTIAKNKEEIVELAIEKIVDRGFSPWTTYTMAKNMLEGFDCQKDEDEANRLFGIAFRKSDALDTIGYPGGTLFVARCMANGYGTKKDLEGALCYYQDYIRTCGSNNNIDKEIDAIKREIEEYKNINK